MLHIINNMQSFGTDLDSAYTLLSSGEQHAGQTEPLAMNETEKVMSLQQVAQQIQPHPQNIKHVPNYPQKHLQHPQQQQQQQSVVASGAQSFQYDANMFNQQYEKEKYLAYLRKQQQLQLQQQAVNQKNKDTSYTDKMFMKKRDVLKIIMFSLMILLAISLHSAIDFWMKDLVAAYQLSYRHELGIKVLYPVIVIILLWNMKVWTTR